MLDTLLSTILLTLANSITIIALKAVNNNCFHMHLDSTLPSLLLLRSTLKTVVAILYYLIEEQDILCILSFVICHIDSEWLQVRGCPGPVMDYFIFSSILSVTTLK